jgi:hypothetical protein
LSLRGGHEVECSVSRDACGGRDYRNATDVVR